MDKYFQTLYLTDNKQDIAILLMFHTLPCRVKGHCLNMLGIATAVSVANVFLWDEVTSLYIQLVFEFVVVLLDWFPAKVREPSLPYYYLLERERRDGLILLQGYLHERNTTALVEI